MSRAVPDRERNHTLYANNTVRKQIPWSGCIYIYISGREGGKLLWARVNYIARLPSFLSSFMETGGARNTPLPEHNEGLIR